jgi:hypothetical protein
LYASTVCCSCGHDFTAGKARAKRIRFNGDPSTLREPIADTDDNLLSLMAAKR